MMSRELQNKIKTPVFFDFELLRYFPNEQKSSVNVQLSRMVKRGELYNVKRGLYAFPNRPMDPFVIASILYRPSYVSLESALNYYGLIPDIPAVVTSVTTVTTKMFNNVYGRFSYSKIQKDLFNPVAIMRMGDARSDLYFDIAFAEKALLDFIYMRHIKDLKEYRLDLQKAIVENVIVPDILRKFSIKFPSWVREVLCEF